MKMTEHPMKVSIRIFLRLGIVGKESRQSLVRYHTMGRDFKGVSAGHVEISAKNNERNPFHDVISFHGYPSLYSASWDPSSP